MSEREAYLVIRSGAPHGCFAKFNELAGPVIEEAGGRTVASASLHEITALEPGSVPAHSLVAILPSMTAARSAWSQMPREMITEPAVPLVLLAAAVPPEGYDDPAIPTIHTPARPLFQPPTLMLIEGSADDQQRMDRYRAILLPLMHELSAYYLVFELGGDVEVLSGAWDEAIFAISRWPGRDAALRFWLARKYQEEAIPLRLGFGRFEVVIMEGYPDAA